MYPKYNHMYTFISLQAEMEHKTNFKLQYVIAYYVHTYINKNNYSNSIWMY